MVATPRWGAGGSLGVSGPPACMLKQRNLDPGEQGTAQMEERSILNTHPGSRRSWGNSRGRRRNKRRERTALDKEESFLRRNNPKRGGARAQGQVREETDWEASQQRDCHLPEGAWDPARYGRSAVLRARRRPQAWLCPQLLPITPQVPSSSVWNSVSASTEQRREVAEKLYSCPTRV